MSAPLVLAIIGKGRSGSTVLDTVLDQVDGVTATGELWHRWGDRPLEQARCGCGARVGACPVWEPVLDAARRDTAARLGRSVTADTVFAWERKVHRWARVPRLLRRTAGAGTEWPALDGLVTFAGALYRALAARTGASVIVDSSKWPATVVALGLVPDLPVRVLHLVRDPHAVAYSWRRTRTFGPGEGPMPRFGAAHSAASWVVRNMLAARVRRRHGAGGLLLPYETLAGDPRTTVQGVLAFAGMPDASPPLGTDGTIRLAGNHSVGGNPARFRTGTIRIAPDDEWRDRQRPWDRAVTGALTAPWRRRYGYR